MRSIPYSPAPKKNQKDNPIEKNAETCTCFAVVKRDSTYSTLIMTFHCNAPASRIAQARHPLLRRLMMAFQPF